MVLYICVDVLRLQEELMETFIEFIKLLGTAEKMAKAFDRSTESCVGEIIHVYNNYNHHKGNALLILEGEN